MMEWGGAFPVRGWGRQEVAGHLDRDWVVVLPCDRLNLRTGHTREVEGDEC